MTDDPASPDDDAPDSSRDGEAASEGGGRSDSAEREATDSTEREATDSTEREATDSTEREATDSTEREATDSTEPDPKRPSSEEGANAADTDREASSDATSPDPTASASEDETAATSPSGATNPTATTGQAGADREHPTDPQSGGADEVPADVRKYERFKKMDGAQYDRVNEFLRDRTYITAREWAIARLCSDFRTETGVEMTKIGENLPELVPFMTDTYTPQAVNQARASFEEKVRMAGATFLYGAMSGFFTAEELDEMMYEVTEVAKFLLEVEGVDLGVETELDAEERISSVMREVREASTELREQDADTDE
jgi:hypothetical protein